MSPKSYAEIFGAKKAKFGKAVPPRKRAENANHGQYLRAVLQFIASEKPTLDMEFNDPATATYKANYIRELAKKHGLKDVSASVRNLTFVHLYRPSMCVEGSANGNMEFAEAAA